MESTDVTIVPWRRITKGIAIAFWILGVSAGAAMFYLENSFLWHPLIESPETERIVAYHLKGTVRFISTTEHLEIRIIYAVFYVGLGVGLVLSLILEKKPGRLVWPLKGEKEIEEVRSDDFKD